MGSMIARAAVAYFEAHPEKIVELFSLIVDEVISHIKTSQVAK
jgi:hypothetical protein